MRKFTVNLFLLFPIVIFSQIIHVPSEYPGIQQGIDAASNGDTVLVDTGTYYENINFKGKAITVASHFILPETTPNMEEGLVAQWLFNGNGNDVSGNGHHGTSSAGHANWGGGIPELSTDRHGNTDYCYKFVDGGNFVVPNDPAFIPEDMTISVWMKLYEPWAHNYFISNDIWHSWKFQVQDANKPFFTAHITKDDGSGEEAWIDRDSNTGILEIDTWHHVLITYTSGKLVFYMDGENVIEWTGIPTGKLIEPHDGVNLCIGQALPTAAYTDIEGDPHQWKEWMGYFKGYLDDMRFYNIILTDEEVEDLYEYERDNTIEGEDYVTTTIIDGGQPENPDSASVVYFINGEDKNAVLKGFTIKNGSGTFIPEEDGTSGGGMLIRNSSPFLSDLIIENNSSYLAGGILFEDSELTLMNTVIRNNEMFCEVGGGMIGLSSDPYIENVILENNAADWGGAVYLEDTDGDFVNVQFTNNEGGVGGGLLCSSGSDPRIINSTFAENEAIMGGSIVCVDNSHPELINSILWNSAATEEIFFVADWPAGSISISYSDIKGGQEGIVLNDNGTVYWLDGNIDEDPLFEGGDNFPFMLSNQSPCVNAGNPDTSGLGLPDTDLHGNSRIYGGRIDMGAYENQDIYVGMEEKSPLDSYNDLQVFPNPFTTALNVKLWIASSGKSRMLLYDQTGRIVYNESRHCLRGVQDITLDAANLPAGMYLVVIESGDEIMSKRVVKLE